MTGLSFANVSVPRSSSASSPASAAATASKFAAACNINLIESENLDSFFYDDKSIGEGL